MATTTDTPETTPVIQSRDLLGTHVEIIIVHQGVAYRLRQTSNNKLILTK